MTRISDEIVEKAWRKAGLPEWFLGASGTNQKLAAFADDMVRDERDACAKICDDEDQAIASAGSYNNWAMREDALKEAAAAIRARSQKTKEQP